MAKLNVVCIGALAVAAVFSASAFAENGELPFGMRTNHINLVLSVSSPEKTHEFYGEILGLKRIPDINFPGDAYMIRYLGGESEVKFIVTGEDLPKHKGGARSGRGIRLMALLLPDTEREGILERLKTHGHPEPTFTKGPTYRYGMVYDNDGNQVELVFLDESTPESKFKQFQIGMTVSDTEAMNAFLNDVLKLESLGSAPIPGGAIKYSYKLGNTVLKFWSGNAELPVYVGGPMEKIGMNLIQFIVPDVDEVRKTVLARGGTIHTGPFPLGKLATIMFVEGPDGILFEFAGPLLPRFRK